jgi:hypothetical protein
MLEHVCLEPWRRRVASNSRTERIKGNAIMATTLSEQVRQFICGLTGHDSLLHFGEGRVSLLCSSCGHETPGWDVKGTPARRQAATPDRRVVRMPLVSERRVA